ncbi:MAG: hypothetical protein RL217_1320 [Pseudomonadota bacterium]|jgi:hypothetical protein
MRPPNARPFVFYDRLFLRRYQNQESRMSHWEFNQTATEEFISRWQQGGGTERANYQLFLLELCA